MTLPAGASGGGARIVPVVFGPGDRAAAARLAPALARAIANVTRGGTLLVDAPERGGGADGVTCADGHLDRAEGMPVAALRALGHGYTDVVLCIPAERLSLLDPVLAEARRVIAVSAGDLDGHARAALARAGERGCVLQEQAQGRTLAEHRRADSAAGARVFGAGPGTRGIDALARAAVGLRVGVALGSGSSRGFAHIGALERLAELGVPVDTLAGSSAGAGIGAVWSLGQGADHIAACFAELARHAVRPTLSYHSVLSGRALEAHLTRCAGGGRFDDMAWPFGVVAVDLYAGSEELFTAGDLPRVVLASCAIPGLYPAVALGGRWFVDGGLLHPVPASAARALGADVIIAVDLAVGASRAAPARAPHALETVRRATEIAQDRIRAMSSAPATVILRPRHDGAAPGVLDYDGAQRYRALGRSAVDAALPDLRAALPWLGAVPAQA